MSDETAWLIELKGNSPMYWGDARHDAHADRIMDWTRDHTKALRLSRKEDAQLMIDEYGWTEAFPCEHMWCDQSQHAGIAPLTKARIDEIARSARDKWREGQR